MGQGPDLRREGTGEAGLMTWYFVCDGCGKKTDAFDENVVDGTGRSLCSCCARSLLEKERFFMSHVPGCVDAEHHLIHYSTWADLEAKVRHWGHIGCEYEDTTYVTLVDVFCDDGKVQWWVLGFAHNGPENPPWPYWKEIVRELGGRV